MTNITEVVFKDEITEAGLAELRAKYPSDLVVDMSDDDQFKAARKTRTEMNKLVDSIKRRRIDVSTMIKDRGDQLIDEVQKIYSVIVQPFEAEDERRKEIAAAEKRAYEEKIAAERKRINEISGFAAACAVMSSDEIQNTIEAVDMIDPSDFHKDLVHEAIEVKKTTLDALGKALNQAIQHETERKAREQAEQTLKIEQAITRLKMLPMDYMGKPSAEIAAKIDELSTFTPAEDKFGNRTQEAADSLVTVINQLKMIQAQSKAMEDAQPKAQPEPAQTHQEEVKTTPDSIQEAKQASLGKLADAFERVELNLGFAIDQWANDYAIADDAKEQLQAILASFGVEL